MATARSAIKSHGGKFYLAKKIVSLFPPHLHYVEPYFGGGAVLFARDPERDWLGDGQPSHLRGASEVVNDINGRLINFWKVVQSQKLFGRFSRRAAVTPFSQKLWQEAQTKHPNRIRDAVNFFVLNRQSRQGLNADFATLSRNRTRRGMNEQVSAWLTAVDGLPEVHERLKTVVVLNDDAPDVIKQQDGDKTFFYLDPPYLHETRTGNSEYGENEMTKRQHRDLLDVLANIKGKFSLSGYPSRLYRQYERQHGWNRNDSKIDNKASSKKTKDLKTESLWMNY